MNINEFTLPQIQTGVEQQLMEDQSEPNTFQDKQSAPNTQERERVVLSKIDSDTLPSVDVTTSLVVTKPDTQHLSPVHYMVRSQTADPNLSLALTTNTINTTDSIVTTTTAAAVTTYSKSAFPNGYSTELSSSESSYPITDSEPQFHTHSFYKLNGLESNESSHYADEAIQHNKPAVQTDMHNFVSLTNKASYTEMHSIDRVMRYDDRQPGSRAELNRPLDDTFQPNHFLSLNKDHLISPMLKKSYESMESSISNNTFSDLAQSMTKKDESSLVKPSGWFTGPASSQSFDVSRNSGFPVFQTPMREFGRKEPCETAVHHLVNSTPYTCHRPQILMSPEDGNFGMEQQVPPSLGSVDDPVEFEGPVFDAYAKFPALVRMPQPDMAMNAHPATLCHRTGNVESSLIPPFQPPPLFVPPNVLPAPYLPCSPFPKSETDELENPNSVNSIPWTSTNGALNFGPNHNQSLELNTARRRNATRESTNTLKTWLQEHINNPYPTKGEKIMLAIITKMTLTQVSTWFANARRRLKKENKMTWTPKHRGEETNEEADEDDAGSDDELGTNNEDILTDADSPSEEKSAKRYCPSNSDQYQSRSSLKMNNLSGQDYKNSRIESQVDAEKNIPTYQDMESLRRTQNELDVTDTHLRRSRSPKSHYLRRSQDDSDADSPSTKMSKQTGHLASDHFHSQLPHTLHRHHHHQHHHPHQLHQHNRPVTSRLNEAKLTFDGRSDPPMSTPPPPPTVPASLMRNQLFDSFGPVQNPFHEQHLNRSDATAPNMNHSWSGMLPRTDAHLDPSNSSDFALGPLVSMYGSINSFGASRTHPDPLGAPFTPNFETWRSAPGESINSIFNGNLGAHYPHTARAAEPFYHKLCAIPNSLNFFHTPPVGHCVDREKYYTQLPPFLNQIDRAKDLDETSPRSSSSPSQRLKATDLTACGTTDGITSGGIHAESRIPSHSSNWSERVMDERRVTDTYDTVPQDALTTTGSPLHSSNSSSTPAFGFSTSPKPASCHDSQMDEAGVWTDSRQTTMRTPYYAQRSTDTSFLPPNLSSLGTNSFLMNNTDIQFSLSSS